VVSEDVAWVSGTGGTVLRTVDGGAAWSVLRVPDADSLDFRDIEAIDANTAYVLSAGEDGRIYQTHDGGANWTLLFRNETKGAFFDCFDMWDAHHGMAMSDPVEGRFLLLRTEDGVHWNPIVRDQSPAADTGEAAFAASGTCLVTAGTERVYLATGGGAQARVFVSDDRGATWRVNSTPVPAGTPSAGVFSLAFSDAKHGVALGGDYQKPVAEFAVGATSNGGRSWAFGGRTSYVSGAAFAANSNIVVAVGTKGTRVSHNRGVAWATIDTVEYNAVEMANARVGFLVGPRGRVAKIIR